MSSATCQLQIVDTTDLGQTIILIWTKVESKAMLCSNNRKLTKVRNESVNHAAPL